MELTSKTYHTAKKRGCWLGGCARLSPPARQLELAMLAAVAVPPVLMRMCDAQSPIRRLPQGQRFCASLEKDCARSWAMLRRRLLNATGPPLVALGQPTTCGYGTDMMERTGIVGIAAGMRRPVVFDNNMSEPMRLVAQPHDDILAAGLRAEVAAEARGYPSIMACEATLKQSAKPLIPHKCVGVGGKQPTRVVLNPDWDANNSYWNYQSDGGKPGKHAAEKLFPHMAIHFISHNAIGAFGPLIAARSIPPALRHGASMSTSARCITARYLDRVSVDALERATALLSRLRATGKIHAVHVRRGDSAMNRECPKCVAKDEPDILTEDRITMRRIGEVLGELNHTLQPGDGVFLASDTRGGLRIARQLLNGVPISFQRHGGPSSSRGAGKGTLGVAKETDGVAAVHSTQLTGVVAATKLLADFIAMAISDQLTRLGDSSLSGCASTLGVHFHGDSPGV